MSEIIESYMSKTLAIHRTEDGLILIDNQNVVVITNPYDIESLERQLERLKGEK